jgi:hypothetical protein
VSWWSGSRAEEARFSPEAGRRGGYCRIQRMGARTPSDRIRGGPEGTLRGCGGWQAASRGRWDRRRASVRVGGTRVGRQASALLLVRCRRRCAGWQGWPAVGLRTAASSRRAPVAWGERPTARTTHERRMRPTMHQRRALTRSRAIGRLQKGFHDCHGSQSPSSARPTPAIREPVVRVRVGDRGSGGRRRRG